MQNLLRRAFALCAFLLGAAVSFAAADEILECADYITTAIDDEADVGHLIGSSELSEEVNGDLSLKPQGIGASSGMRRTETYQVGVYEMSNGSRIRIDCRDYTVAN
jgi:hypothetical protein